MKRSRLGYPIAAGAIAAATIILAAPAASARPVSEFAADCREGGGTFGVRTHYEFDADGDVTSAMPEPYCHYADMNETTVDVP